VLTEVMQACLEAEPQVAITRHLLQQAPNATLIPEEISVNLTMVDQAKEFACTEQDGDNGASQRDRISLGSAFVVNKERVSLWGNIPEHDLPGASLKIPDALEARYQAMLFTKIRVYKEHQLDSYDSGLTCPRIFSTDKTVKAGDIIQFRYQLGSFPQLLGQLSA